MEDSPCLSTEARSLIGDPANIVFVSAVSLWEIELK
jgi:PIN domain nuclease of toxin-antitoxin system